MIDINGTDKEELEEKAIAILSYYRQNNYGFFIPSEVFFMSFEDFFLS